MDHAQLRAHGSKLFHLLDRHAHNEALNDEREHRFFDLKRQVDGWFTCAGELDPVGGTFLQIALLHRGPRETELAEFRGVEGDCP